MNLGELQNKLIAAARSRPVDERVPYAFEKGVMARLQAAPVVDAAGLWARALWRAAAPCVAVTLLLGIWSAATDEKSLGNAAAEGDELSQYFEQTMLAGVDESKETW